VLWGGGGWGGGVGVLKPPGSTVPVVISRCIIVPVIQHHVQ